MSNASAATEAAAKIAELETALSSTRAALGASHDKIAELTRERDRLREAHERTRLELELLKRRLFVAKAERVDTAQLELEFAAKLRQLEALAGTLSVGQAAPEPPRGGDDEAPSKKRKPRGRARAEPCYRG